MGIVDMERVALEPKVRARLLAMDVAAAAAAVVVVVKSEEQRLKVPKRDADSAGTSSDFRRPQICRAASSISKSPLAAHPRRSWTSHTGLVAVGRKLQTGDPAARRCLAHITGAQKSTARSAHGFYFLPIFAPAAAGTWL
ncbi:hypothetical protein TEQG_02878 [Trichophyton equinum CBS 127.97]|uniref:Uncharacterized protein n=1 Tax=Trichophyton equinum (strain ATCC MYA-4606 / CBS 127.97) TaxID=559882 RepID=F2PPM6_TRIEC|nr:hypothetical protein TEQG_02878 [Trichophyton equinum CBS 127.97]